MTFVERKIAWRTFIGGDEIMYLPNSIIRGYAWEIDGYTWMASNPYGIKTFHTIPYHLVGQIGLYQILITLIPSQLEISEGYK
jgi:hypothetical protein